MELVIDSELSWIKELETDYCTEGTVLCYYLNEVGEVHFEINGKRKGILFAEVDTSNLLWVYILIGTVGMTVKFIDPCKLIHQTMRSVNVDDLPKPLPSVPLPIHKTKGLNVLTNEFGEAASISPESKHGYVFVDNPIKICYIMFVQILETRRGRSGSLGIGVTSWDPENLKPEDLPEDPEMLIDRPEYWVTRSDLANNLKRGDYIGLSLRHNGEINVLCNGKIDTIMNVNNSVPLWIFVNICGATKAVRLLRHESALGKFS